MRNAPDKNPFRGVSDLLSRASPAKRNLHFLSYIVDLLLVFIVSYLLFLGGRAIVDNTSGYKKNYAKYDEEITYYQDLIVEAHLAEYLDRDTHQIAEKEDLAVKMAISQILLSYSRDDGSVKEFDYDPTEKLKQTFTGTFYSDCFVPIAFENDYISKFIMEYAPLHNENNELIDYGDKEPLPYTISFYKRHASNFDKMRLAYQNDEEGNPTGIPYLKPEMAYKLFRFLVRENGSERTEYDAFVNFYSAMLEECEDAVFNSSSYQSVHYRDYLKYRQYTTQAVGVTLMLSIVLAYYLIVFLPQMIFKDGRSFGKIFFRLGSINTDKSEVQIWKLILRSLLASISCIFIAFFIVLLPPFYGSSMILYLPFITIGSFDITFINIVIVIFTLAAINGIVMLLNHDKRSVTDFIFRTVTVDVTMLDEPDFDENNE